MWLAWQIGVRLERAGAVALGKGEPAPPFREAYVREAAEVLSMYVAAHGHEVLVENTSLRALERAPGFAPDVCLLDIGLPDIDGHELARRLRADPRTRAAVMVAVTGYGQDQDRRASAAAGFDHHLVKAVDMASLGRILEQAAARGKTISA